MTLPKTERGFRIFMPLRQDRDNQPIHVLESSLAFEGPHCRIYLGSACAHLDIALAAEVASALVLFIDEAMSNQLVEQPTEAQIDAILINAGYDPRTIETEILAIVERARKDNQMQGGVG